MRNFATFIVLSTISLGAQAQAQQSAQKVETQTVSTTQAAPSTATTLQTNVNSGMTSNTSKQVSGFISVGYGSNLYEKSATNAESTTSADLMLNYKVSGKNLVRAYMAGSQSSVDNKSNLKDGYVGWVNDSFWSKGDVTSVGQHVRLAVPVSRESRLRDEKLTGVTVAPIAVFNLTPVGLTGVMLAYQPAATKNFHKYQTNKAFVSNNSYTLSQLFRVMWSFTEQAYVVSDFVYRNAWSYENRRKNDVTTFSFQLGYSFLNGVSLAGGISTDSTIRNLQNANDTNADLFNKRTSSVFTGLSYAF